MVKQVNKLRKAFNSVVSLYINEFEEKHDCYLEYWVADDTTGIASFGDHFFNLSDIIYDIDNNCPAREIFHWQDHCVEKKMDDENAITPNFKSYLGGIR